MSFLFNLQIRMFSQSYRKALYAGSFDPPTSGHLDIIKRGLQLCDKLYVGIAINQAKKPIIPYTEREKLIQKITKDLNVEVVFIEGLLADYVHEKEIDFMIRGIRSYADFDSEIT